MKPFVLLLVLCGTVQAGVFVPQSPNGSAPSGILWSSVATGTAMPIRSSGTANGRPGAVAYITNLGILEIDPKGWNISSFSFSYTGTMAFSSPVISQPYGTQGILPSGTWSSAVANGRTVSAAVSLVGKPTLSTKYALGNGASTTGWFNQPWAFPPTQSPLKNDLFSIPASTSNVLGYGNGKGVFSYTVYGVVGNQTGPVIPSLPRIKVVAVPEPSLGLVGILLALCLKKSLRAR